MIKKMIILLGLIVVIFIIALFAIEYMKDSPKTILDNISMKRKIITTDKPSPLEGEKLSYTIKYLWIIPIGIAEIKVGKKEGYKNHKVYPLTAEGKVSDFLSRFIKAEGTIKSYVDINKFYTWKYEEKTHAEGHRPSDKVIFYHQDINTMEFRDIKRKIPENTQDPLSALFCLRWQDYEKNKYITFNVNSNKENYTLYTEPFRRESVSYGSSDETLLILQSQIKSPKEYSKSEAKIETYITDDASRIPLLMKIRTKFGPIIVRLTDIKY